MTRPLLRPGAETWLNAPAQIEAEGLLRNRFRDLHYWNVEESVAASMSLDGTRSRFLYLRGVLPGDLFESEARVLVSGAEAGSEMIVAREQGFGPVHGVDVDPLFVEVATRRLAGLDGFECRLYDGARLPYPDGFFELALSGHVIEHSLDPPGYVRELLRVLRKGGFLFLEYPTRYHHTELHTGLPSLEWAPGPIRKGMLRLLSSRFSPLDPEVRRRYGVILETGLHPVSLPRIRTWIARSGWRATLLHSTRAAPGVIRAIFRKEP